MLRGLVKRIPGARRAFHYVDGLLRLKGRDPEAVFSAIFRTNGWRSKDSASGTGSDLTQTRVLRDRLPPLLRELGVRSMLDVPSGDFAWMRHVDLGVDYTGADIVREIVERNQREFGGAHRRFVHLDLITGPLPRADLVFCRDCLVHLSHPDALRALDNIRVSGARYLMATTFPGAPNEDIVTGQWRPIDLVLQPFNLPDPLHLIYEECTEPSEWSRFKAMGVWRLQ